MAEFLVIRLGTNPQQSADWIAVDNNGTRRTPPVTGPLAEAARDVGDRSVIVLVPSTSVLSMSVDIPIKGGARLRAALPFALEEHLAALQPRARPTRLESRDEEAMERLRSLGYIQ